MCFALPTTARSSSKPSRLPAGLRVALGGIVLLTILLVSRLASFLKTDGS